MFCVLDKLIYIFQDTAAQIARQLLSALQYDNQLSVRYLIEWQVVLLLCSYPDLIGELFLPCLNYVSDLAYP